ncbi:LolA family protein [Niabella drilacis]|uniref:Chaperone LolA n=1 Tax=Niabella drilacis (strain DSM 25811 / CCM 8410 / CCUG 62505 / LMG 26954 / E90) TaxID=1285928 RepID=A0A1G6L537_NIADE|nr:outer membrane lipoprotein carrier protein LolA [Niabella drilacis]SDC38324.1 chaperone LolA [Niabella drilacis]
MKKLCIGTALLFMGLFSFAQQRDPKAKAILDAASEKFKSYQTVTATFAYASQNAQGKVMAKKNGTINMKGDKFNISFGNNKIFSDGKTVWNYDPSSKEVTVNNANKSESTITPQKLFTDFYSKDFMYVMGNDSKVAGKPVHIIIMQPIDKNKAFSRLYLAVDKAAKTIASATIVEKNGNRTVYSVGSLKANPPLADAQFSFDQAKYPGVEVVDLR